jgi:hypothetical protein
MHPAILVFLRALTYPDLLEAATAADRLVVDGVCNRVIFVYYENPKVGVKELLDRRNPTTLSSKQNDFEADMILKTVVYISQQGYKTDRIAVLMPYLGQLRLLIVYI